MATTLSLGAVPLGDKIKLNLPLLFLISLTLDSISLILTELPFHVYLPELDTDTILGCSVDGGVFLLLLPGRLRFNAFGITNDEVNIKKIKSKKIMSVKDDMLNSGLTLLLFFNPIIGYFLASVAMIAFTCNLLAIAITSLTLLHGTPTSAMIVTVAFSLLLCPVAVE